MTDLTISLHLIRKPHPNRKVFVHVEHPILLPNGRTSLPFNEDECAINDVIVASGSVTFPASEMGLTMFVVSLLIRMDREVKRDKKIQDVFLSFFHRWLDATKDADDIATTSLTCWILEHPGADPEVCIPSATNEKHFEGGEAIPVVTGVHAFELLLEYGLQDPYVRGTLKILLETLMHDGELAWRKARELEKAADSTAA